MNIKLYVFAFLMMAVASVSVNMGKQSLASFNKEFSKVNLKHYENSNSAAIDSKILNDLYIIHRKAEEIVCSE